jgi:Mg/Co/Ni transporter MgtE
MRFKYLKILLFAVIANLGSFLVGLALEPLFGNKILLIIATIIFLTCYIAIYLVVLIPFFKKNRELES